MRLINTIHPEINLPKGHNQLFESVDVQFNYTTYIFCTNCMKKLKKFSDRCSCNATIPVINSELVLVSLPCELRRVLKQNIKLIEWYRRNRQKFPIDITSGKLFFAFFLSIICL